MTWASACGGGGGARVGGVALPTGKKLFSILCGGLFPPYGGWGEMGPFSLCVFFSSHRDLFSTWVACFLLMGGGGGFLGFSTL